MAQQPGHGDRFFVLRATTPEDLAACMAIRMTVFVEEQKVPVEVEADEYDKTALHYLAKQDGKPVATARVIFKEEGRIAKIQRVAVLKEGRGTGIGRQIMQSIENDLVQQGIREHRLDSQTHAIPFYERLGYIVAGDEFMDAGIPHRSMHKLIQPKMGGSAHTANSMR